MLCITITLPTQKSSGDQNVGMTRTVDVRGHEFVSFDSLNSTVALAVLLSFFQLICCFEEPLVEKQIGILEFPKS